MKLLSKVNLCTVLPPWLENRKKADCLQACFREDTERSEYETAAATEQNNRKSKCKCSAATQKIHVLNDFVLQKNKITILVFCLLIFMFLLLSTEKSKIPSEQGSIQVYFCPKQNCTAVLMANIDETSKCAFYDLDMPVSDFLKSKKVGLVIHYENYAGYGKEYFSSGLMHDKFCVTNNTVVTGSFNPTIRADLYNNNNLLIIDSYYLAKNYENEYFNLLNNKKNPTPYPEILFNNFTIKNYFCPRDNCQQKVLQELGNAEQSIYFMLFSFTDDEIGELLIHKSKTIEVHGVLEKSQNNPYNEYEKLRQSNIDVIWDSNPYNMHHKVFIIDGETVITGSYNPTRSADEKNNENIMVMNNEMMAKAYLGEFQSMIAG